MSNKAIQHLARNPRAMMRFQATGRLPQGKKPDSPLIRLLDQLTPRQRLAIEGIRIHKLGYSTGCQFRNAEQLLQWLRPSREIFGSYPAESHQNRQFARLIALNDLLESSQKYPPWVKEN